MRMHKRASALEYMDLPEPERPKGGWHSTVPSARQADAALLRIRSELKLATTPCPWHGSDCQHSPSTLAA